MSKYFLFFLVIAFSACASLSAYQEAKFYLYGRGGYQGHGRNPCDSYDCRLLNKKNAMELLDQGAEEGDVKSQFLLANLYLGILPDNYELKQMEQFEEKETVYIDNVLLSPIDGIARGGGVLVDGESDAKAFSLFLRAAEQGHVFSQHRVGEMYEKGWGTKQSYDEARKWFLKAGEKGILTSYHHLGVFHLYGRGVEKDDMEARRLFRLAGDQKSEEMLAMMDKLSSSVSDNLSTDFVSKSGHLFSDIYEANKSWMWVKCNEAEETVKNVLFCNQE